MRGGGDLSPSPRSSRTAAPPPGRPLPTPPHKARRPEYHARQAEPDADRRQDHTRHRKGLHRHSLGTPCPRSLTKGERRRQCSGRWGKPFTTCCLLFWTFRLGLVKYIIPKLPDARLAAVHRPTPG